MRTEDITRREDRDEHKRWAMARRVTFAKLASRDRDDRVNKLARDIRAGVAR